ncbi:alcohol dehydrogenase zinc-binding domain protein [Streptomyces bingchenggensis BCW-1]|uniref:Alcohol dehydrogenase zinc-binding domain protein n=1 Tax=Streptomyces bingchenggensis (strain BCW-1) TaxID=749414 RepID=D7CAK6_STRBB|nr:MULTISPECIES: NADP-dependent oxidoreductase [Streptomyces]ADI08573.1 alcohol dehydrogenase zinc-binding domain protein [Streptomyces bingchenggensis BCW-1]
MTERTVMRAAVVRTYGGPEAIEIPEVPRPEPGPGQVRIRVAAATVNPVDLLTRAGTLVAAGRMAPRAQTGLGWDVAGVVDATGPGGVRGFRPGDPVIGLRDLLDVSLGTYAEYVVLDATAVAPAPEGVPAAAAATLPLNGLTAWQSLDALDLPSGATLLVTGAAGAAGGFAVELAALRGLRVAAVAGAADEKLVRGLGAEWFIARDAPDLAAAVRALVPGGVAGALDAAGAGLPALAAVRNAGAFVAVAADAPVGLRGIRSANHWISADGTALAQLSALAAAGRLTLRVADTLPLDQAQEAHRRLAVGGLRGRLVLTP